MSIKSPKKLRKYLSAFSHTYKPSVIDEEKYKRNHEKEKYKLEMELLRAAELSQLNDHHINIRPQYKYLKFQKATEAIRRKERLEKLKAKLKSQLEAEQLEEFIEDFSESEEESNKKIPRYENTM